MQLLQGQKAFALFVALRRGQRVITSPGSQQIEQLSSQQHLWAQPITLVWLVDTANPCWNVMLTCYKNCSRKALIAFTHAALGYV